MEGAADVRALGAVSAQRPLGGDDRHALFAETGEDVATCDLVLDAAPTGARLLNLVGLAGLRVHDRHSGARVDDRRHDLELPKLGVEVLRRDDRFEAALAAHLIEDLY